eukprot:338678_1
MILIAAFTENRIEKTMSASTDLQVSGYYNHQDTHDHYTHLWGEGNIHFGYFGSNIDDVMRKLKANDTSLQHYDYPQVAEQATLRLSTIGGINSNSVVLDLGCGYGKSAAKILSHSNCKMIIGLDLSTLHIEKAKQMAIDMHKANKLKFICGSFVDFPSAVKTENCDQYYTHIWSEAALSHCHPSLHTIVKQCKKVLNPINGKLVINDVIANEAPTEDTKTYVYNRMKYDYLASTKEYVHILQSNGFKIMYFEELSRHLWLSYKLLIYNAMKHGDKFKDLITKYKKTCESIERDEFGMINIVAQINTKSKM